MTLQSKIEDNGLNYTAEGPFIVGRDKGHFWRPRLVPTGGASIAVIVNDHFDEFKSYNSGLLHRSDDGGKTWGPPWAVAPVGWANGFDPERRKSFVLPYDEVHFDDDDHRTIRATRFLYDPDTNEVSIRPGGLCVSGFPRRVSGSNHYLRPRNRPLVPFDQPVMFFHGHVVPTADIPGLVTTMFGAWEGDPSATPHLNLVCVRSDDGGVNWRYLSTIARPDDVEFEQNGPGEASVTRLEDGSLLCVFRVDGTGSAFYTSRSRDDGATWQDLRRLPESVYGVDPAVVRLTNGVLVLRGGRPGLKLWTCSDGEGLKWNEIDILDFHNRVEPDLPIQTEPFIGGGTSSYGDICEVEPNVILLVYDYLPRGWKSVPVESPEWNYVFALRLRFEKD